MPSVAMAVVLLKSLAGLSLAQHNTAPLQNAADPGVSMPFAGLGMPCGPTYSCKQSSYEGTLSFLALGGQSITTIEIKIGASTFVHVGAGSHPTKTRLESSIKKFKPI